MRIRSTAAVQVEWKARPVGSELRRIGEPVQVAAADEFTAVTFPLAED